MQYQIIGQHYRGFIQLQGDKVILTSPALQRWRGLPFWRVKQICIRRRWRLRKWEATQ